MIHPTRQPRFGALKLHDSGQGSPQVRALFADLEAYADHPAIRQLDRLGIDVEVALLPKKPEGPERDTVSLTVWRRDGQGLHHGALGGDLLFPPEKGAKELLLVAQGLVISAAAQVLALSPFAMMPKRPKA